MVLLFPAIANPLVIWKPVQNDGELELQSVVPDIL
jgi:hypothetical protein